MSNDVIRSDCSANEYEYDLTVIVPIYNGENFLSNSLSHNLLLCVFLSMIKVYLIILKKSRGGSIVF